MTQSLVSKLLEAANRIHKAQMKGTSNYIIASPYFSNALSGTIRKELRKEKIRLIFND
jgi:hypothetical protein